MKLSSFDGKNITLTITLPACGSFEDYLDALQKARDEQVSMRNHAAAQALHALLVLARGGVALHNLHPNPPLLVQP